MVPTELERILYIHLAQICLALLLCSLFFYYFKHYKRPFLKWWSISWFSYALISISTVLLLVYRIKLASLGGLLFAYLQIVFLIVGVNEFSKEVESPRQMYAGIAIALVISVFSYFLFINDPEGSNERYILRVGLKALIMAVAYGFVALKVLYSRSFQRSFSKYFLIGAFGLYGLQQFWHSIIVFSNVYGEPISFPVSSFGIIDIFSLSVIGLGMIMWLLDNQHAKLLQANKELDNFLYSTSHDLRAPIASILGLTNLAKLESKDKSNIEYYERIESRIQKLDSIVTDILNYSKSSKQSVSKDKIDFKELVEGIFSQLRFANSEKVELTIENKTQPHFYSDITQITVILNNLISNAIKYADLSKEKPEVKVKFSRRKEQIKISVIDNGIGIDQKCIPKVFDMFFRATSEGEGSGLGLYIAKEAADKLKAKFEVQSKVGHGSKFTVLLNENWI